MTITCQIQTMAFHWARTAAENSEEYTYHFETVIVHFSPEPVTSAFLKKYDIDLNVHLNETVICTDVSDGCHIVNTPDHRYLSMRLDKQTIQEKIKEAVCRSTLKDTPA